MIALKSCQLCVGLLVYLYTAQLIHPTGGTDNCASRGSLQPVRGQCPQETTELIGDCCQICTKCAAGTIKEKDECLSPCTSCDDGTWRTDEFDQTYCLPCIGCGRINRVNTRECVKHENGVCGGCMDGYYEDPYVFDPNMEMACIKCDLHNPVEECEDFFNITKKEPELVGIDKVTKNPAVGIPLLILIIGVLIAVVLVIVCRSRRRLCGSRPSPEFPPSPAERRGDNKVSTPLLQDKANAVDEQDTTANTVPGGGLEEPVANGHVPRHDGSNPGTVVINNYVNVSMTPGSNANSTTGASPDRGPQEEDLDYPEQEEDNTDPKQESSPEKGDILTPEGQFDPDLTVAKTLETSQNTSQTTQV